MSDKELSGMTREDLADHLHKILPAEHAGKKDLLPLYTDPDWMREVVSYLAEPFEGNVDLVLAPEPFGMILGSQLAYELGVGFLPIRRRKGEAADPDKSLIANYIDHRNEPTVLSAASAYLSEGKRVLIADDWIETGVTLHVCRNMLEDAGVHVAGIAVIGADYNRVSRDLIDLGVVHHIL
ncbi:MAG: phosphoribosyltransferase family protein [Lachnospiraceae bacterium]|nr:phosphoribosyltransferase family protein [Lachnospiraceae bacterium]